MLNCLKATDDTTELYPLLRMRRHSFQGPFRGTNGLSRQQDSRLVDHARQRSAGPAGDTQQRGPINVDSIQLLFGTYAEL